VVVTAVGEGVSGTGPLTVVPRVVEAKLDTIQVVAGDSVLLSAKAHPQDNPAAIPGATFTFSASPSAGVTFSQRSPSTALIKTSAAGTFSITATNLGVVGSTSLTVLPRSFIGTLLGNETGIDAGRDFGCGLIPLGRLYCWGLNSFSQLGAKPPEGDSVCFEEGTGVGASPCRLTPIRVAPQLVFSSVSAGDDFACGLTGTGKAYCWGSGTSGKLGNGGAAGASAPTPITFGSSFTSISAGGNHTCAIGTGGTAYCWGQDDFGQLGDARLVNSTTPIPVVAGGAVAIFSAISAGLRHTCALDVSGSATCWGLNNNGQLGAGVPGGFSDQPLTVAGGISFNAISAGGDTVLSPIFRLESHTCGIATNGAAWCWGSNGSGQLGNGSVGGPDVNVPTPVAGGFSFSKISAGSRFTCGLTTGGAIYCWGHNSDLQLGRGPFTGGGADSGVPQIVSGGELPAGVTFVSVTAGRRHACGIGSDGAAYCWGSDVFGALGNTFQAAFRGLPQRVATPQ
jgi:alpha-tubulin suppressor-like RCC1 family protein